MINSGSSSNVGPVSSSSGSGSSSSSSYTRLRAPAAEETIPSSLYMGTLFLFIGLLAISFVALSDDVSPRARSYGASAFLLAS
jgi:hypothetical protein